MSKPSVILLAIGNELSSGKICDTNSSFLAKGLRSLGFETLGIEIIPDKLSDIESALRRSAQRAELLLTTGGLGPTSDDLTREAVSRTLGKLLEEDARAKAKLEALFNERKRPLHENNYRQVQFPSGAEILTNRLGTADAFVSFFSLGQKTIPIVSLPGVPKELEIIFAETLSPWLQKYFSERLEEVSELSFRCFGCSESFLGRQIESAQLGELFEVAYRPMFPEVLISLLHLGTGDSEKKMAELEQAAKQARAAIGEEYVIAEGPDETLPKVVAKLLSERGLTLSAAESCSGGLVADAFVSIPSASKFFLSSLVTYSNDAKSTFLGVRPGVLERFGAVSAECALEMARGARYRAGANVGVSISGIAGPDGGSAEKPVGTFFIGLATAGFEQAWEFFYPHERNMFRKYSSYLALDVIRRHLLGFLISIQRK